MTQRKDYSAPTVDWEQLAQEDPQVQLPVRRDTFVPARHQSEFPLASGRSDDDTALMTAAAAAVSAGAGGVFENTSSTDRAIADALRVGVYAVGLVLLVIALAFFWNGWDLAAIICMALGAGVCIASALSHRASLRHSAPGVALAKLDTMREMHRDTLTSRERIAATFADAWLRATLAGEETERERVRRGRQ